MKFVLKDPIRNGSSLVPLMTKHHEGNKLFTEPIGSDDYTDILWWNNINN